MLSMRGGVLGCIVLLGVNGVGACDGGIEPAALPPIDGVKFETETEAEAEAEVETETETAVAIETETETETTDPLDLTLPVGPSEARAGRITRAAELIGGPKAEGLVGDFKLYNDRVAVVVEGVRRAGGYRLWGGSVIDVDTVHIGPGADLFGELWLGWNLCVFRPDEAVVVSDGRAGGTAAIRLTGRTVRHPWPESFLGDVAPDGADLAVTYDYTLAPGGAYVELALTLTNDTPLAQAIDLPFVVSNQGDGTRPYLEGPGLVALGNAGVIPTLSAVGLTVSYAVEHDFARLSGIFSYQNFDLLQLDAFTLAPGEARVFHLAYTASSNGTTALAERRAERQGGPLPGIITGHFAREERGALARDDFFRSAPADEPPAYVVVHGPADPDTVVGLVPVLPDGSYRAAVPAGRWEVTGWVAGLGSSDTLGNVTTVNIAAGAQHVVDLAFATPAHIAVAVTDRDGQPLPAQVAFTREGATPSPFPPDNQRFDLDWREARSAVLFLPPAGGSLPLAAGTYTVTASRGPTYELATETLTVSSGDARSLTFTLEKSVDTTGWIAGDMHTHAAWSSDSSVPYATRALQAAANDLALPVTSDHGYVGDLGEAVAALDYGDLVAPMPAQEVTTFAYGHFNAFPLVVDLEAPSRGAIIEHGHAGLGLFEAMRAQHPGEMIIQVNHPRSGGFMGYFTATEYDAVHDIAGKPEHFTRDWDALEVFNGSCGMGANNNAAALADWFALNNNGHLKTLSSGSDSHDERAPIGEPRNWIAVDLAAVALDPSAIVAPIRARRSFVSCGPFVRFRSEDGKGMGEIGGVDASGAARFAVEVQAPSWMGIDSVALIENGVVVATEDLRGAAPDPARKALRFDGVLAAQPTKDSWYAVEVVGSGTLAPIAYGHTPYALTNAIQIDANGDGLWTAPGPVTP